MPVPKKALKRPVKRVKPLLTKVEQQEVVPPVVAKKFAAKKVVKKRSGGRNHTGPNKLGQTQAKARAFELYLKGESLRKCAEIVTAEGYQVSHSTIDRWIDEECNETLEPLKPRVRKVELARYNSYLKRIEEDLDNGGDVPKLIMTAVRVSEARRKLLGVDEPVQTNIKVEQDQPTPDILTKLEAFALQQQEKEEKLRNASSADEMQDEETSEVKKEEVA